MTAITEASEITEIAKVFAHCTNPVLGSVLSEVSVTAAMEEISQLFAGLNPVPIPGDTPTFLLLFSVTPMSPW